ncbi:MAG: SLBB domain-containing protein [Armatimonadota bacterium]|nr:SLBB domain-containing protein [Armatimonadota bacterium]
MKRPQCGPHRARAGSAVLLAVVLVLALGIPSPAQVSATYVLQPGDVIEVSVWFYADLTRTVTIRPDGGIMLPLIGSVTAAGLTVEQLTRVLSRRYASYIVNPKVSVIVKDLHRIRASALGQVARPGSFDLMPGARLLDLLAAAGGLTEAAAAKEAQLLRPGRPPMRIDLDRLLDGDEELNVKLQGGETLVVPEDLVNIVNVIGQVAKPGRYRLKGETRVLDALLLAGGLTERASVTGARLVRGARETQPLALDSLLLRQDMSHNVVLQAGDTLFIPEETNDKIYVLGDVNNPGVFQVKGEVTLLQALAMAGGPVQRPIGNAQTAHIVRRVAGPDRMVAGVKVEPMANGGALISVDLASLMRGNNPAQHLVVRPGDVVVVPQHGLAGLQIFLSILSGILGVFR